MPTESTFLFAGLLFLAAALGYVFARFGDDDEESEGRSSRDANVMRGFRYLLDEEPDRAIEVFTGLDEVNEEVLDTQIALGALFRRRGEIDRAIRLHQTLLDRPSLAPAQRDRAAFALAEDYLGAGLFDRAEELLMRLRDSPDYRAGALQRLVRVCEVTGEWGRAIDLSHELSGVTPGAEPPPQLAHYFCELTEQARRRRDFVAAGDYLDQAETVEPGKARTALLRADLALDQGETARGLDLYAATSRAHPALVGEILPRLVMAATVSGADGQQNESRLGGIIRPLCGDREALRGLALAAIRDPRLDHPAILDCLAEFVIHHPVLSELVERAVLVSGEGQDRLDVLRRLQRALNRLMQNGSRYQCANCGYTSASRQWQCPGCRQWDTVRAVDPLFLTGSAV